MRAIVTGVSLSLLNLINCSNPVTVENPDGSSPGDITLGPISGMSFAYIPSGFFQMGSPTSDPDSWDHERPVHTVTFSYDFEMMTTEVTQGMWEEVMGNNPSYYQSGTDYPIESVSWNDCQDFVDAMNDLDPAHEYRLPSEAEWEYCCRAGTTTRFYWGDVISGNYCWYYGNSTDPHPVGQKTPNAWGLHDMIGNVAEWCQDWYHESYSGAPADGSSWVSPSATYRVDRGGCFYGTAGGCRSASRSYSNPVSGHYYLGLRLARSAR